MGRPLSELTLEELWQLFPIRLTEHQPYWAGWYREERERIGAFLPLEGCVMSHVGSTAIPGIWAKPIVDILLEIPERASMDEVKRALTENGYLCMAESQGRKDLNRGYTSDGFAERVFHLHLRRAGDNSELYFRDYMNAHPQLAKEYEALKLGLWREFEHDRDGYTAAKTEFVAKYTEQAKREYPGRYERAGQQIC